MIRVQTKGRSSYGVRVSGCVFRVACYVVVVRDTGCEVRGGVMSNYK